MFNLSAVACVAGNVGGGVAIDTSDNLVRHLLLLSDALILNCTGHRGGAVFSTASLAATNVAFEGNVARENGGGVAIQPPPCGSTSLTIEFCTFRENSGQTGVSVCVCVCVCGVV